MLLFPQQDNKVLLDDTDDDDDDDNDAANRVPTRLWKTEMTRRDQTTMNDNNADATTPADDADADGASPFRVLTHWVDRQ